ncbi:MAG: isopentenyl phosphate kinase [Anaerolineales bacterium]
MPPHGSNKKTPDTVFLKLGGSLITDKSQPRSPRKGVLARLAQEIAAARKEKPDLNIVLGHGSGSFGHTSGQKYHTRDGVHSLQEWEGFTDVWFDAADLNHIVMETLHDAHIPALSFPPSSSVYTQSREVIHWNTTPLEQALEKKLLPVVYGDVVFDKEIGGTILSTEEIFVYLTRKLKPQTILLAGQDPGVWADYPKCTEVIPEITPQTYPSLRSNFQEATTTDVTGGMASKVKEMVHLVQSAGELEVWIFSGRKKDQLFQALIGQHQGTHIHNAPSPEGR